MGDIDGDGLLDFVFGAPNSLGGSKSGATYLFSDAASWTGNVTGSSADHIITGSATDQQLGTALPLGISIRMARVTLLFRPQCGRRDPGGGAVFIYTEMPPPPVP